MKPSKLYLPKLTNPPATILEYLYQRFPHLAQSVLRQKVLAGQIFTENQQAISIDQPYQAGITLYYYREVADEPAIVESERILFRNDDILVVDKPHFMPVTPAGQYLQRSLIYRLQQQLTLPELTPVHRIDLETAGLVLCSLRPASRGLYHRLFETGRVIKEYLAVVVVEHQPEWQERVIESRIVPGEPWYRMQIVEGAANAITRVAIVDYRDNKALVKLWPSTGKKHQLRIQLASLGMPISNDPLYPELNRPPLDESIIMVQRDYQQPLQLLAQRLSFLDPITDRYLEFESTRSLQKF